MKTYRCLSTSQWAWGASAHWRLYHSLKTFSKRCSTYIYNAHERFKIDQSRDTSGYYSRQRNSRYRHTSTPDYLFPESDGVLLADETVNEIIQQNEVSLQFQSDEGEPQCSNNIVAKCEINQLGSNKPNEDQVFVTQSPNDNGLLFGVLDGHGGVLFGEKTKTRLPYYIHTSLLNPNTTTGRDPNSLVNNLLLEDQDHLDENEYWLKHLKTYTKECLLLESNDKDSSVPNTTLSYMKETFQQIIGSDNYNQSDNYFDLDNAIKDAFLRLDNDLMEEVFMLSSNNQLHQGNIGLATSGCCALIAYLLGKELYIANLGDCRAVLGSQNNGSWESVQLTQDHTAASNSAEVQRILSEHPTEESRSCLSYGRLLGRLAPLRALGDFQFKLTNEELLDIFKFLPKYSPFSTSLTPPYLSAEPDVFRYKLNTNDRFIVLASDGLWDMLSNDDVVQLVASYIEGKQTEVLKDQAHFYNVPNADVIDDDSTFFNNSLNENVASFLIRQALGGYDQGNLKYMLSLKHPDVRLYRDDISIVVIFLKEDSSDMDVGGNLT